MANSGHYSNKNNNNNNSNVENNNRRSSCFGNDPIKVKFVVSSLNTSMTC